MSKISHGLWMTNAEILNNLTIFVIQSIIYLFYYATMHHAIATLDVQFMKQSYCTRSKNIIRQRNAFLVL